MVSLREPQERGEGPNVMWSHHNQVRFTLVWAALEEQAALRDIVVRSLYALYRGEHVKRSEPDSGFQIHEWSARGMVYQKILWVDSRVQKLKELRYQLFSQLMLGIAEERLPRATSIAFQLDSQMQGHTLQFVTGKDIGFRCIFAGDLDRLGVWQQGDLAGPEKKAEAAARKQE